MDEDDDPVDDEIIVEEEKEVPGENGVRIITVVHPSSRVTSDVMTVYEFWEVVGIRAQQIESGGAVYTDAPPQLSSKEKAMKEIFDRRCPLMVIRKLNSTLQEEWEVNEMGFPADVRMPF